MELYYYNNFSKRKNSTKIPPDNTAVLLDANAKNEGISIHSPKLIVRGPMLPLADGTIYDIRQTTYVKFDGKYYFVDDITVKQEHVCEMYLSEDVLANHRTEIGNYIAYVEYADNGLTNEYYDDMRIPSKSKMIRNVNIISNALSGLGFLTSDDNIFDGTFIIKNVSTVTSGYSSTGFWFTDSNNIVEYMNYVQSHGTSILNTIEKYVNNVSDATISTSYIPIKGILTESNAVHIKVGAAESTALGCTKPGDTWRSGIKSTTVTVDVPFEYDDWRDLRSVIQLYLPYIGYVNINAIDVNSVNKIKIDIKINCTTGLLTYLLYNPLLETNKILGRYEVNVMIDTPLTQISVFKNEVSMFGAFAGSIGGMIGAAGNATSAGGAITGVVSSGVEGLTKIVEAAPVSYSRAESSQTILSIDDYSRDIEVYVIVPDIDDSLEDEFGKPLFQTFQIKTLQNGYIKCRNASIDIDSFSVDRDEINSYLNGGFYYE